MPDPNKKERNKNLVRRYIENYIVESREQVVEFLKELDPSVTLQTVDDYFEELNIVQVIYPNPYPPSPVNWIHCYRPAHEGYATRTELIKDIAINYQNYGFNTPITSKNQIVDYLRSKGFLVNTNIVEDAFEFHGIRKKGALEFHGIRKVVCPDPHNNREKIYCYRPVYITLTELIKDIVINYQIHSFNTPITDPKQIVDYLNPKGFPVDIKTVRRAFKDHNIQKSHGIYQKQSSKHDTQSSLTAPTKGTRKVKQLLHQGVKGVELEAALANATKGADLKPRTSSQIHIGGFVSQQTAWTFTIHTPNSGLTANGPHNNELRFYSLDSQPFDPSKTPLNVNERYGFTPLQPGMRVDKPGLQLSEQDLYQQGAVVVFMPSAVWSSSNPQTLYLPNQQHFEVMQPDRANDLASSPIEFTPKVPNEQIYQIQATQEVPTQTLETVTISPLYLVITQTSQHAIRNQGTQVVQLSFQQQASFSKAVGDGVSSSSRSYSPWVPSTSKGTLPQGNLVSFSQIVASQKNTMPRGIGWYTKGTTLYSGGPQVAVGAAVYTIAQAAGETPRASENWGFVGASVVGTIVTWGQSLNAIGAPVFSTMTSATRAALSNTLAKTTHILKGTGSALKTTGIAIAAAPLEATAPVIIIPATIGLGMFAISKIPLEQASNRDQFYTLTKAGVLTLGQVHALLGDDNKPYIILSKDAVYSNGLDDFLNQTLSLGQAGQVFHRTKDDKITTLHTAVPISAPKTWHNTLNVTPPAAKKTKHNILAQNQTLTLGVK